VKTKYLKIFVDSLERYRKLSDAEYGRLMRAALTYKATGEEVKLTEREELLWDGMKLDIDRDNDAYDVFLEKQRENGAKGGRPQNPKNPSLILKTQKSQDKDNDQDKDKDIKKTTSKKVDAEKSSSSPPPAGRRPSFLDFEKHIQEKQYGLDAQKLWAQLEKNNWQDCEGNEIRNWKSYLKTTNANRATEDAARGHAAALVEEYAGLFILACENGDEKAKCAIKQKITAEGIPWDTVIDAITRRNTKGEN